MNDPIMQQIRAGYADTVRPTHTQPNRSIVRYTTDVDHDDEEIVALQVTTRELDELDPYQQRRIVAYLLHRYGRPPDE